MTDFTTECERITEGDRLNRTLPEVRRVHGGGEGTRCACGNISCLHLRPRGTPRGETGTFFCSRCVVNALTPDWKSKKAAA